MATTPWVAGLYADLFAYKNADARATFQHLEDEQTRATLLPATPRMEWEEPQRWQLNRDVRLSVATLELDTGLVPILPRPAWDEVEWQHWFGSQYRNQTQEADAGPRPLIPAKAWDEVDWQKWTETRFQQATTEQDTGLLPILLPSAFEDSESSRDFNEKRFWLESDVLLGVPFVPSTGWFDENAIGLTASYGSLAGMVMLDDFVDAPSGSGTFGSAPGGRSVRFGFSISNFR